MLVTTTGHQQSVVGVDFGTGQDRYGRQATLVKKKNNECGWHNVNRLRHHVCAICRRDS